MEDRKKVEFTGITDVISFEPVKVMLESDYGVIVIKGDALHVNKLSVEKGELGCRWKDRLFGVVPEQSGRKKGESLVNRLFR